MNTIKDDGLNVVYHNSDEYITCSRIEGNDVYSSSISSVDNDLPPGTYNHGENDEFLAVNGIVNQDDGLYNILYVEGKTDSNRGIAFIGSDFISIVTTVNSITINERMSLESGDYTVNGVTFTIEGGLIVGIS